MFILIQRLVGWWPYAYVRCLVLLLIRMVLVSSSLGVGQVGWKWRTLYLHLVRVVEWSSVVE